MGCFSCTAVAGPVLPICRGKDSGNKRPMILAAKKAPPLPIQVRREQEQNLQANNTFSVPRREAMLHMTAGILGGFALLSAKPAEARGQRLENRRKAMEKLEKLREKAGLSKPPSTKGEKPSNTPVPPPPQNLQGSAVGPLVEASLPYQQ